MLNKTKKQLLEPTNKLLKGKRIYYLEEFYKNFL